MKINLGCGIHPIQGYVNIDVDKDTFADIYQDINSLGYKENSIEEIYFSHVLEHLTKERGRRLIVEIYKWLTIGGRLIISVPDTRKLGLLINVYEDELLYRWLYGDGGDRLHLNHKWGYSEFSLRELLTRAGFTKIELYTPEHNDDANFRYKGENLSINLICTK